ncbi:MAG: hypothetical protein PUP93_03160 [Rhizonema sp. NSF051]|nr:hypothetical protein [Rhizonema sp. NSF051]
MLQKVKKSMLVYAAIADFPLDVKTKILLLASTPEWEHYEKLMQLIQQNQQNKAEILQLISEENIAKSSIQLPEFVHR